jgi:lysozyme family protein
MAQDTHRQLIDHVRAILDILESETAKVGDDDRIRLISIGDGQSVAATVEEYDDAQSEGFSDFQCPDFEVAFERLIGHEGGFQNHRNDRGNWTSGKVGKGELKGTKFGISAMSYPDLDIPNLTVTQAREIYQRDFWNRFSGDELDARVAFNLFDASVHHGVANAVRLLQRAVNVDDDGVLGPVTLAALQALAPEIVAARLNAQRLLFCTRLSTWRDFGAGWANRFAQNILDCTRP